MVPLMWRLAALVLLAACGCTARALAPPDVRDGGIGVDLALARPFDLASPPVNPCPAGTSFIYTIETDAALSRFSPGSGQFFDVGTISCPSAGGATPNSMAVDREGNGWVNFSDGSLFRLITATDVCTATTYAPGQGGLQSFGMSFAEDAPGSTAETLFIADQNPGAPLPLLASVDLGSFTLSSEVSLVADSGPELTGDDQANLWGFFPSSTPPRVARIDKQLGTLDRTLLLPTLAGSPRAWGVAAYQGDFYIFLQRDIDPSTVVYRLDGATGAVTTVADGTGRRIVGVGVATCAGNGG